MLVGGEPTLVIGKQTVWRVPIILTSSKVGEVGTVGVIDVNVENGEINVSEKLRGEILENAKTCRQCRIRLKLKMVGACQPARKWY